MDRRLEGRILLVTGGSGQLGARLVPRLASAGARVVVVDRDPPAPGGEAGAVRTLRADLRDPASLGRLGRDLAGVDGVVHLASAVEPGAGVDGQTLASVETNAGATLNLLEALPPVASLCFASSMMVYGRPRYAPIDEAHPTDPTSVYGVNKLGVEKLLACYGAWAGLAVAILRFSSLYGPGRYSPMSRNRAIPRFIRRVHAGEPPVVVGDGTEKRDYLFLDDAVEAVLLAVERRAAGVYNVGSGQGTSVAELAAAIIALSGGGLAPRFEPAMTGPAGGDFTLDIGRARRDLGFAPRTDLAAGLTQEIRWYAETGVQ